MVVVDRHMSSAKVVVVVSLLYTSILPLLTHSEIITVAKQKNSTSDESESTVNSTALSKFPVITKFAKTANEVNDWVNDDWFTQESDVSSYSPITDQRWEDLTLLYDQSCGMFLDDKSVPLSVYVRNSLNIVVLSRDWFLNATFGVNKFLITKSSGSWHHFTLQRISSNTIQVRSEENVIQTENIDFKGPYWLYVETPNMNNTFCKLHKYEFRWSNTTNIAQQESYVSVPFSDNLCLSMYVSVNENSLLQVTLTTNSTRVIENVTGFNVEGGLKKWKKLVISANSSGTGELSFLRMHEAGEKHGYWAVDDISFCDVNIESVELENQFDSNRTNEDVFTGDSDFSLHNTVIDERREDSKLDNQSNGLFLNDKPVGLSAVVGKSLIFVVLSREWSYNMSFALTELQEIGSNGNWFDFILERRNNSILIWLEGKTIKRQKINFDGPYWVFFETPDLNNTNYVLNESPEVPIKCEVKEFSDEELFLTWNKPFVTNEPFKSFDLRIRNRETIEHSEISATDEVTYEQKISVTTGSNYVCSLRVVTVDTYPGEIFFINITIAPSALNWQLPQPFAKTCSKTCQLVILKPKERTNRSNRDYYILASRNRNIMDTEALISEILNFSESSQGEKTWIAGKLKEDSNLLRLEIDLKFENITSLEEDSMYLILRVYDSRRVFIIIAVFVIILFSILFLFLGSKYISWKQSVDMQLAGDDQQVPLQFEDAGTRYYQAQTLTKIWWKALKDYFKLKMVTGKRVFQPNKTYQV